jgi:hypothetical protein
VLRERATKPIAPGENRNSRDLRLCGEPQELDEEGAQWMVLIHPEHRSENDLDGDLLHDGLERDRLSISECRDDLGGDLVHLDAESRETLTVYGGHHHLPIAFVLRPIECDERRLADDELERDGRVARRHGTVGAREDVARGVRRREVHDGGEARQPRREDVAVARVTLFEERDRLGAVANELVKLRRTRTGGELGFSRHGGVCP